LNSNTYRGKAAAFEISALLKVKPLPFFFPSNSEQSWGKTSKLTPTQFLSLYTYILAQGNEIE
jgi:hypothetical protein